MSHILPDTSIPTVHEMLTLYVSKISMSCPKSGLSCCSYVVDLLGMQGYYIYGKVGQTVRQQHLRQKNESGPLFVFYVCGHVSSAIFLHKIALKTFHSFFGDFFQKLINFPLIQRDLDGSESFKVQRVKVAL